jgi:hypothetical protein
MGSHCRLYCSVLFNKFLSPFCHDHHECQLSSQCRLQLFKVRDPILYDDHAPSLQWDISPLPANKPVECPAMPGLWCCPGMLDAEALHRIKTTVDMLPPHNAAANTQYEYEPSRFMTPIQPYPNIDANFARGALADLKVFDFTDPLQWSNLADLTEVDGAGPGAAQLIALQRDIQAVFPGFDVPCLFQQVQKLERGAQVTMHKDNLRHGGSAIATAVIDGGTNEIRVGAVTFPVTTGDVYGLVNDARHRVGHAVYSSPQDRLSITLRYGQIAEELW